MEDRELLELAAKAAGYEFHWRGLNGVLPAIGSGQDQKWWNPLADDGDALRLATKLRIDIYFWGSGVEAENGDIPPQPIELFKGDDDSATRRAIVRAAVEMGKGPPC